jgi:nucleoside-diphosphate-sugar epimerase
MRVLVIGGTRFIGPHVVRGLHALGHEVTVFHRGEHDAQLPPDVRRVRSPDAAMPVVRFPETLIDAKPDVVVHMVAMGEEDADAAANAFTGRIRRLVVLSSGDVYRAYGRFTGLEPGPIEGGLLTEGSPLRQTLYPYRASAQSPTDLTYAYDKILVERRVLASEDLGACVLRLPKVYGPGDNADLATVFANRDHPEWRWTHLYVENVAAAVVLAALHPAAAGRVYNVGERETPTVAERMARLPPSSVPLAAPGPFNFSQDIAYDTTRIRAELGYTEPVTEEEGIRRTFTGR